MIANILCKEIPSCLLFLVLKDSKLILCPHFLIELYIVILFIFQSSQDCKISNSSKKTSKMKKLRNEIEVLNMINAELTEELETITETVSRLGK